MYSVVMTASGSPTSNGMPIGIALMAKNMAEVTMIMLHVTGCPRASNTRNGMLKLKAQETTRKKTEPTNAFGLWLNSTIDSWKCPVISVACSWRFFGAHFPLVSGKPEMVGHVSDWLHDFGYSRHHPDDPGEMYVEEF